jgi:hypothetical protein
MAEDLVLLTECSSGLEVAHVKSLLTGEGIDFVVQGEHHANLLGGATMPTVITPRVLVHGVDLERAMAALEAPPQLGVRVCPVHEELSTGTCAACGTDLCAKCVVTANPVLCESCAVPAASVSGRGWHSPWVLVVPLGLIILVALLMQYLGVVPD